MIYYLSGPISACNNLEENLKAFKQSAQSLREQFDLRIISPTEIEHKENATWHDYMKNDIAALLFCDAIILLKGWAQSKGARAELMVALSLDLKVFYFENHELNDCRELIDMNFYEK